MSGVDTLTPPGSATVTASLRRRPGRRLGSTQKLTSCTHGCINRTAKARLGVLATLSRDAEVFVAVFSEEGPTAGFEYEYGGPIDASGIFLRGFALCINLSETTPHLDGRVDVPSYI